MNFARRGSPGMRTVLAKELEGAEIWGVIIVIVLGGRERRRQGMREGDLRHNRR